MKEDAIAIAMQGNNPTEKLNLLREYLQAFTLRSLHESEAFQSVSFVGGTALRFLHDLARFSEDLDFSLENLKNYNPEKWIAKLKRDFEFAGFESSIKFNMKKIVHSGWVDVSGLMKELELSNHAGQTISIKIEIDTNPPKGARTEKNIINKYFLFAIRNHSLPSLMAGKIHAVITRPYHKGRDYYDFLWYLTKRPPIQVNMKLLQASFNQTLKTINANDWKSIILKQIDITNWKKIVDDVAPFLERPSEIEFLNKKSFEKILKG